MTISRESGERIKESFSWTSGHMSFVPRDERMLNYRCRYKFRKDEHIVQCRRNKEPGRDLADILPQTAITRTISVRVNKSWKAGRVQIKWFVCRILEISPDIGFRCLIDAHISRSWSSKHDWSTGFDYKWYVVGSREYPLSKKVSKPKGRWGLFK